MESRTRYKEKRKTDDGEKRKDEHPQRIPMTITRYPKCHLTINGSMQRRNSNLKRRTRSEWNSELRGFMPEFSGRRTRQTDEKKG